MLGSSARVGVLFGGLVIGIVSVTIAGASPEYSYSGVSWGFTVAGLLAGWSLIAAGVLAWQVRPDRLFGPLLAAAGFGWFLLEWDNPGVETQLVFSAGLILHAVCPALVGHALLGFPDRTPNWHERVLLAVGYVVSLVFLGLLPTIVFDPDAQGCTICSVNPLVVRSMPDLLEWSQTTGLWLGIGWGITILVLLGRGMVRTTVAGRRLLAPVLLPGIVYIGLVVGWFWTALGRGFPVDDATGRMLWFGQALALTAIAIGAVVERVRLWRTRTSVARLVVDMARAQRGELRDALAAMLGDPSLAVLFPLPDGRTVDVHGHPAEPGRNQVVTELRQGDRVVALLTHRAGLLDDPRLADEITSLARLALHTERLQAETLVQLSDLRASLARIVDIGDAERRRLEHDLHDGVQQRLVTLALSIRLARMRAAPGADGRLATAETEVRHALADLRELAHGLCPAVLDAEGLAAGLESLAEGQSVRLTLTGLPLGRFDRSIESAAYLLVAETVKRSGCSGATVQVSHDGERLVVAIELNGAEVGSVTDLEDRVGAAHGSMTVDGSVVRAEFPCAS